MAVQGIDHVNIDTTEPEETIAFYCSVLGLENRPQDRPGGIGDGAWLFNGDQAVVHLNFHAADSETGRRLAAKSRSGAFNHVAFAAEDFAGTCRVLDEMSIQYRVSERPDIGLQQIFIRDPNNVAIELNIRT